MRADVHRLSLSDWGYLRIEEPRFPTHFGVLAVLGPGLPTDARGALDVPEIRRCLERRLDRAPELRRSLHRVPLWRGRAVWGEDPAFAIDRHVRVASVAAPGGEEGLLAAAESLLEPLLDRAHPLWELWLLAGLPDRRTGMLVKLHHSVTDGLGALALLGSLFGDAPSGADAEQARVEAPPRQPLPARTLRSVAADAIRVVRAWNTAPRTSLNGPRAGTLRARVVRLGLERARAVGHAAGGTVNDVVLAVVAGGLRDVLLARGEAVDGVELAASIPVALRTAAAARALGNAVGTRIASLPVGEPDAARLLARIARGSRASKAERPVHAEAAIAWMGVSGVAGWMADRQRTVNVFVTNVRGPQAPWHVLGGPVEQVLPLMSPTGNIRVLFAVASYCGQLAIVVNADGAFADLGVLVTGMEQTWRELSGERSRPARAGPQGVGEERQEHDGLPEEHL